MRPGEDVGAAGAARNLDPYAGSAVETREEMRGKLAEAYSGREGAGTQDKESGGIAGTDEDFDAL